MHGVKYYYHRITPAILILFYCLQTSSKGEAYNELKRRILEIHAAVPVTPTLGRVYSQSDEPIIEERSDVKTASRVSSAISAAFSSR